MSFVFVSSLGPEKREGESGDWGTCNGSTKDLVEVQSKTGVQGSCYGQGCEGECIYSCWSKQHRGGGSVQIGFYKES